MASGDAVTLTTSAILARNRERVLALAYHPAGAILASGAADGRIYIWDTATGELQQQIAHADDRPAVVSALAYSPDGAILASGTMDGLIQLWDTATGSKIKDNTPKMDVGITSLAFSPNGDALAAWTTTGWMLVWQYESDSSPVNLLGHSDAVTSIAYNPTGTLLVSNSDDSTIRLLDTEFLGEPCSWLTRNLSLSEWREYIISGGDYDLTCPNLPLHPSFVEEARATARSGNVEDAIAQLRRAVRLDPSLQLVPETEAYQVAVDAVLQQLPTLDRQGRIYKEIEMLKQAVGWVMELEDAYRSWQICAAGRSPELQDTVRPACASPANGGDAQCRFPLAYDTGLGHRSTVHWSERDFRSCMAGESTWRPGYWNNLGGLC